MKALAAYPNSSKNKLRLIELPIPHKKSNEVLVKTIYTGICRTDTEVIMGGTTPPNSNYIILQHEAVGKVVKGDAKGIYKPGDIVIPTVRRGCDKCGACKQGRSDYCLTGCFKERGINGLHGFGAEYFVEDPKYLMKIRGIPTKEIVLIEPLSVVYKAIERIQHELKFLDKFLPTKKVLIIGAGTIGQLTNRVVERMGHFDICVADIIKPDSKKIKLIHGHYIRVRSNTLKNVQKYNKNFELIFEAAGAPEILNDVILEEILSPNGALMLMGLPEYSKIVSLNPIHQSLVLKNQSIIGSVNASTLHFQKAIEAMRTGLKVGDLVTQIYHYKDFNRAFHHFGKPDSIKILLQW